MRLIRKIATGTFLWFALAGAGDALVQIVARPYWFSSAGDRVAYTALLAFLYGAAGLAVGALAGTAAALLFPLGRGGSERLRRSAGPYEGALLTLLFWGGFWIHRTYVGRFFSPAGFGANGLLLAVAIGAIVAAVRLGEARARASRRAFLVLSATAVLLLGAVAIGSTLLRRGAPRGRPNVLLVVIDTLRADRLSCYGNPRTTSPALDRLAREGALFADAISPAPFTQPGVAAILTGTLPSTNGVVNHPNRLASNWTSLAELFRDAGYRTAFANSHPLLTPLWGFTRGFDEYRYLHKPVRFDATLLGHLLQRLRLCRPDVGYRATVVTDFAIRLLRRGGKRPFFVYAHYLDPHFPYIPPEPFDRRFSPTGRPSRLLDERMPDGRRRIFGLRPAAAAIDETVRLYDGEIAYTDRAIGRLLDELDRAGLREKTIVAVTADHGENLGEHDLFFAHTHLVYEPTQRVPLLMRYPGKIPAGRLVVEQVGLTGLAPTLLSLAGIGRPEQMRGAGYGPLLAGRAGGEPFVFAENGRTIVGSGEQENPRWLVEGDAGKMRMVRDGRWELIRPVTKEGIAWELYDLAADPAERKNLAAERPDVLARLRVPLDEWIASIAEAPSTSGLVDDATIEGLRSLGYIH